MKNYINYAVIGLGYIAQKAVLPAFRHARENSRLNAFISGDPLKLRMLGKKYSVKNLYSYEEFDECMASGKIDALYIATPNSEHRRWAERAAFYGIHVLCEKPMAVHIEDCASMLEAADKNHIKLMVAYRLHFEEANLYAIQLAHSNKIGELKIFNSSFAMQVRDRDNIRLKAEMGGGSLYDIGVYCVNAARYLFREEPIEVFSLAVRGKDPRFREIDEITSAILHFPNDKIANFVVSFGAASVSSYDLIGSKGHIRVENAYEYELPKSVKLTQNEKTIEKNFGKTDQFAPELIYFSNCILKNQVPEPSGLEGMADLKIISALMDSIKRGIPVGIAAGIEKMDRPNPKLRMNIPPIKPPRPIHARGPGEGR